MTRVLNQISKDSVRLELKIFAFTFPLVTLLLGMGLGLLLGNLPVVSKASDQPLFILGLGFAAITFIGAWWYFANVLKKLQSQS